MANEHRTPDEIERDVERQRADLSHAIDEMQRRFTPEAVFREFTRSIGTHGDDMGRAMTRSVKQNPLALTVTAVGLAWLIFGRSHDDAQPRSDDDDDAPGLGYARRGDDPYSGARRSHEAPYPDWVATGDRLGDGEDDDSHGDVRDRISGVADDVRDAGRRISDTARSTMESARRGMEERGRSAAERAPRARGPLSHGVERMSDAARERVMAARERAMAARYQVGRAARGGWRRGRDGAMDFFEEQPLVAGALALAAGAAIAGAIPRTRTEDDWMGEESDRLIADAERVFHEELHKVERVGSAALDEAKSVAQEKRGAAEGAARSAVSAVTEEARDAADRVSSAAEDEARRQDLGDPRA